MALFKYFKCKEESLVMGSNNLPDEDGPLRREVPFSSIREANLGVLAVTGKHEGKRSSYSKIFGEQKVLIAKYAAENRIMAVLTHFAKDYPDGLLKESTVKGWKKEYLNKLVKKKRSGKVLLVKSLPCAKKRRPLMLGSTLDKQVQAYLIATYNKAGGVVNSEVAIAAAMGIV